jgi:hypothetical protein
MAAPSGDAVSVTVDASDLKAFAKILAKEADSKKLRRELAKELRNSLKPAVVRAKASINAAGHTSKSRPKPALRASIARNIRAEVRLSGKRTGARVKAKKVKGVRGFENAPKLFNRKKFRRPVFGDREDWVDQVGKPEWFDDAMQKNRDEYVEAVNKVLEDWAKRITRGR